MPRKLPWMQNGSSSSIVVASPIKRSYKTTRPPKRARDEESKSEDTTDDTCMPNRQKTQGEPSHFNRVRSKLTEEARSYDSSPPLPEPPSESFMHEGMDHDDKYRMVEDEFLTVAQRWTVHLHAAEYKKQQQMVKDRNAAMIDSIARPVTERMPNQTRRRLEGIANSKKQQAAIKGVEASNASGEDTNSDEDGVYYGAGLHDLMVSPGKRITSLSKIESAKATTRAAAGFQQRAQTKTPFIRNAIASSPSFRENPQASPVLHQSDISTASEDEDDDLDAPISTLDLHPAQRTRLSTKTIFTNPHPSILSTTGQRFEVKQRLTLIQGTGPSIEIASSSLRQTDAERSGTFSGKWRARRLEKERQVKEAEGEAQKKKKVDIIPTFL